MQCTGYLISWTVYRLAHVLFMRWCGGPPMYLWQSIISSTVITNELSVSYDQNVLWWRRRRWRMLAGMLRTSDRKRSELILLLHLSFTFIWCWCMFFVLSLYTPKQVIFGLTLESFRELSFSRLECGVTTCVGGPFTSPGIDTRYKRPMAYNLPTERHCQCGVYELAQVLKRRSNHWATSRHKRYTVYNVDSQFLTPKITCMVRGSYPEWRCAKPMC